MRRSLAALLPLLLASGPTSGAEAQPVTPTAADVQPVEPPAAPGVPPAVTPGVPPAMTVPSVPSATAGPAYRPAAVAPVAGPMWRAFEQPDGPYGRGHRGVDLRVRPGEPVRAAMPGTVRFAGQVAGETWITLTHADGLETTYGGATATVGLGQRVALGQQIGRMRAGRRHLDWGARLGGGYVDPLGLLAGWRVRLVAPE